jgi:dipeptidyl aminopeptidase/acylaminoacyl peptidase
MMRRMRILPSLAAAVVAVLSLPAQQLLSPEGLWRLQRASELTLSPDGRYLAFVVRSTVLAENRSTAKVCLIDLQHAGAGPKDFGPGSQPVWFPGSNYLAVVTKDGIEARPLDDGPVVAIPVAGGVGNLLWAPNGENFSYTQDVKVTPQVTEAHPDLPKANARAYDDLMVRHWDHWVDGTYSHLFVQPYTGGGRRATSWPASPCTRRCRRSAGSSRSRGRPTAKELCYTARRVPNPEASTDSSLWAVSKDGGASKNLTPELPGYDQEPVYSPDGRWIAFGSMARPGFEADRLRLMLHDRSDGTNANCCPTSTPRRTRCGGRATARACSSRSRPKARRSSITPRLPNRSRSPVTRGRHAISDPQVAADGRTVYALRTTMERPAEVVQIDVAERHAQPLTDVNGTTFANLAAARHRRRVVSCDRRQEDPRLDRQAARLRPGEEVPVHPVLPGWAAIDDRPGLLVPVELPPDGRARVRGRRRQSPRPARLRPGLERPDLTRLGRPGDAGPAVRL